MSLPPRPRGGLAALIAAGLVQLACSGSGAPPPQDTRPSTPQDTRPSTPQDTRPSTPQDTRPSTPVIDAAACQLPTQPASTPEETAWRIFVAMNCSTNIPGAPLVWETWKEQSCIADPSSSGCEDTVGAKGAVTRKLHGSHLRHGKTLAAGGPSGPPVAKLCSEMTTKHNAPSSLLPFIPSNLAKHPTFCEEAYANAPEVAYIKTNKLNTLTGQVAYVNAGNKFQFPTDAIELKADWLPASSLTTPFSCDDPPADFFVEKIAGTCYALVAMHISSKLYPNWLWASFEPQSTVTNPNRCNPKLYGACNDRWGSVPAVSTGAPTKPTPELLRLMTEAKLPIVFHNYRLTGTQTDFSVPQLGSSFVEFNAGVPAQQASCITCHFYAQLNLTTKEENPNFGAFPGDPAVGQPAQVKSPWVQQDFSWLLGIMPVK